MTTTIETRPFDPDEFSAPADAVAFSVYHIREDEGRGNLIYSCVACDDLDALFRECLERQGVAVGSDTSVGMCDLYTSAKNDEGDILDGWPLTRGGVEYLLARFRPGIWIDDEKDY